LKGKFIVVIAIVAIVILAAYSILHSIKRLIGVALSDNYLVVSDGLGPYTVSRVRSSRVVSNPQDESSTCVDSHSELTSRFVSVKFEDAQWKDRGFLDIASKLPSADYRLSLHIGLLGHTWNYILSRMIGEHFEPEICISFNNVTDGSFMGALYRNPTRPAPPQQLSTQGHAYLVREGEGELVLDVDAWFMTVVGFEGRTYYVRLTFRAIVIFKPLI